MAGNRNAATDVILKYINKLIPNSPNYEMYRSMFAKMSDAEFDKFMLKLESGEIELSVVTPNLADYKLTVENNFKIAEELSHKFFERIWMTPKDGGKPYLTNHEYLVVDLPLRRQAQLLQKKISIPVDNNTIDNLSGQPTGDSKGSKISYPETQIMAAMGLDNCLIEFIKYRGGDLKGFNLMNSSISNTGGVDMEMLDKFGTKVKSTSTLRSFLVAMHLNNSLPH